MDEPFAYAIQKTLPSREVGWRCGMLHYDVFHGDWDARTTVSAQGTPYAAIGEYMLLHLRRSGRFVPEIFYAGDLIFSPRVQEALKQVRHLYFLPVIFEHLVDLPMPKLGDFSWELERIASERYPDSTKLINGMSHKPDLETRVEGYRALYSVDYSDLRGRYSDFLPHKVRLYKYDDYRRPRRLRISRTALREHGAIDYGRCLTVLSYAVFKRIAPFFDLDYFVIELIDLEKLYGER